MHPGAKQAKKWKAVFDTRRNSKEDDSFVRAQGGIHGDGNTLAIFLGDCRGLVPSCKTKEVLEFCEDLDPQSLLGEPLEHNCDGARAWLNDSEFNGKSRKYMRRLTDKQLYASLKEPRFGVPGLPSADRRLIYIADLSPSFILSLAETASFHQLKALRDAIWKHLAFQTSIRVKIPPKGYPIFRLELHLPYLALREFATPPNKWPESIVKDRPRRKWTDLSFLDIVCKKNHIHGIYGICEAQISFVICGSDHSRWTGYAFVDTSFNTACCDSECHADEGEDGEDEEEDEEELNEDPVASDEAGLDVGADKPRFDPRHYFLCIMDSRMEQVLQEWRYLVRTVEKSVSRYQAEHLFALSDNGSCESPKDVRSAIDWTVRTIRLLCLLRGVLLKTLKAWERFDGSTGDINYFSDVEETATIHLEGIRESFEELMDLDQTLSQLQESCCESKHILELRMNLEGNRLNLESHALNRSSHELSCQASQLHRDSHRVSLEINRVNLENGRTTQLGFWMNQTLGPLGIVVAIFGTQQEIFHFNRNPTSFVLSVIASILLVQLLIFILNMADRYSWLKRCSALFNRLKN